MQEPTNFSDFIFPSKVARLKIDGLISGALSIGSNNITGIILYGAGGTSKSKCAELLPDALDRKYGTTRAYRRTFNCKSPNNGVDMLAAVDTFASSCPMGAEFNYVILEEVDQLTREAMKQLKLTMNAPRTVFIMTTNDLSMVDSYVRGRSRLICFEPESDVVYIPTIRQIFVERGFPQAASWPDHEAIFSQIVAMGNNLRQIIGNSEEAAFLLKSQ